MKNVLLFMSSNGYLVPPSQDPSKEKLWSESWKRIDRFLPDLRKDLALEEQERPQSKGSVEPPAAVEKAEDEEAAAESEKANKDA